MHCEDPSTQTHKARRQLSRDCREETAYDLSEPKKEPPEEYDDSRGDRDAGGDDTEETGVGEVHTGDRDQGSAEQTRNSIFVSSTTCPQEQGNNNPGNYNG